MRPGSIIKSPHPHRRFDCHKQSMEPSSRSNKRVELGPLRSLFQRAQRKYWARGLHVEDRRTSALLGCERVFLLSVLASFLLFCKLQAQKAPRLWRNSPKSRTYVSKQQPAPHEYEYASDDDASCPSSQPSTGFDLVEIVAAFVLGSACQASGARRQLPGPKKSASARKGRRERDRRRSKQSDRSPTRPEITRVASILKGAAQPPALDGRTDSRTESTLPPSSIVDYHPSTESAAQLSSLSAYPNGKQRAQAEC